MGVDRAIGVGFRLDDPAIGAALMAAGHGDLAAHVSAEGTTSHAAMRDRIRQLAGALLAVPLRRGQRVGVSMPASAERMAICAAIWMVGGVVVPLDPCLSQARLTMALQGSGLRLVVHQSQGHGRATTLAAVRHLSCDELMAQTGAPHAQLDERAGRVQPDHPAVVLYGEGRQDTARGVVLSHRALRSAAQSLAARYDIGPGARLVAPLALNHAARMAAELAALLTGATLCDLPAFTTPASHLILADLPPAPPESLPLPELQPEMVLLSGDAKLVRRWERALPESRIFNSYVRAELAGIAICSDPRDPAHTGHTTTGRPLGGVEVMIVDPRTSMDMLLYEIGEIWIRGAPVMLRYHDDLRASRKAMDRSGFFRTGDLGYLDSEGRVIVCRDAFAQI